MSALEANEQDQISLTMLSNKMHETQRFQENQCTARRFRLQQEVFMQQNYTAVIKQDAGWWIGWIEKCRVLIVRNIAEAPVETLRVTLREALDSIVKKR